jgi:hypothetical protein
MFEEACSKWPQYIDIATQFGNESIIPSNCQKMPNKISSVGTACHSIAIMSQEALHRKGCHLCVPSCVVVPKLKKKINPDG